MDRRRFLATSGTALGASLALSGCLGGLLGGGNAAPPPRESAVFEEVEAGSSIRVVLESNPMVESRVEISGNMEAPGGSAVGMLTGLSPIGVARAGGRGGRGATGRGRGGAAAAPLGHHGRSKYHGGDYDDWREDHRDEIERYTPAIAAVGVAYLARSEEYAEDPPGVGKVPWDTRVDDPDPGQEITYDDTREGWYRTGAHLVSRDGSHDFGWESVDFELEPEGSNTYEVDTQWKVSPRL